MDRVDGYITEAHAHPPYRRRSALSCARVPNQFPDTHPGERVLSRVDRSDPEACWIYEGTPSQRYGQVWDKRIGNNIPAHVAVYEWVYGPIPAGLHVHHRCERPRCANPHHLVALTPAERNALHKTKTHCSNGHEFTPENTLVGKHQRICRTCAAESQRKWAHGQRHPCLDCGTEVSRRAIRCHSCHAKFVWLGRRVEEVVR